VAPDYRDTGHRPHAVHTGEEPRNEMTRGPYGITVTLDAWGPVDNLYTTMFDALQSNWGDAPSRTAQQPCRSGSSAHRRTLQDGGFDGGDYLDHETGWCKLTDGQRAYVESCFNGKTLNQILEMLTFEFTVDGVARVFTHQFVRTRIGAGFMQHGGRDNDWRHRKWTMPETLYRACSVEESGDFDNETRQLKHCITDWEPIERLLSADAMDHNYSESEATLRRVIENYLGEGRRLYSALVDAGIPWQDARRLLWMGTQTYIHGVYNYLALQGVCNKRLEPIMDWEINAVAQLMVREVRMKCHPLIGKYLQSLSDKLGKDALAGLESWTPSGKYEVPADKQHLERTHWPEQAPFWVLHPDSTAGGPIVWVPTNGQWPKEW
jgi:thymidylate synthase ThyX